MRSGGEELVTAHGRASRNPASIFDSRFWRQQIFQTCYASVMYGRAWQSITGADLRRLFGVDLPAGFVPRYNLAPTQNLLVVIQAEECVARLARWGLIATRDQPKALSTFNARVETAARSPVFREAFRWKAAGLCWSVERAGRDHQLHHPDHLSRRRVCRRA